MSPITGTTRGGKPWSPKFVEAIDVEKCIGCGRCFKVCGYQVLELIEKPFTGDDEFGDDMGNKVMSVAHPRTASAVRPAPGPVPRNATSMWRPDHGRLDPSSPARGHRAMSDLLTGLFSIETDFAPDVRNRFAVSPSWSPRRRGGRAFLWRNRAVRSSGWHGTDADLHCGRGPVVWSRMWWCIGMFADAVSARS